MGDTAEAEHAFRAAADLAPTRAVFQGNLGMALAERGRRDEALAALSLAVTLDARPRLRARRAGRPPPPEGRRAGGAPRIRPRPGDPQRVHGRPALRRRLLALPRAPAPVAGRLPAGGQGAQGHRRAGGGGALRGRPRRGRGGPRPRDGGAPRRHDEARAPATARREGPAEARQAGRAPRATGRSAPGATSTRRRKRCGRRRRPSRASPTRSARRRSRSERGRLAAELASEQHPARPRQAAARAWPPPPTARCPPASRSCASSRTPLLLWARERLGVTPHLAVGQELEVPADRLSGFVLDGTLPPRGGLVRVRVISPGWKRGPRILVPPRAFSSDRARASAPEGRRGSAGCGASGSALSSST